MIVKCFYYFRFKICLKGKYLHLLQQQLECRNRDWNLKYAFKVYKTRFDGVSSLVNEKMSCNGMARKKKSASICPSAQNLILICTFTSYVLMLIIEQLWFIWFLVPQNNCTCFFFRLMWMLLSLLNTHASVAGSIVHATKNLNFLLNFLMQ